MRFLPSVALALGGFVTANPVPVDHEAVEYVPVSLPLTCRENLTSAATGSSTVNEFGSITPENAQKWDATEPNRGQFNWGAADQHMNWARQNGKHVRCHTLVWYSQLPGWVSNSRFNNATLIQVMTNHINQVMGRYRGQCNHWDVVNEAVLQRLHLEYLGPKVEGAARIVRLCQQYGVRIDGVGYQGHLVTESTPTQSTPTPSEADLTAALKITADLGVDVAYTEIDIRMRTPSNAQKLQALADAYGRVARSCMNVPRCVGMTIWVRPLDMTSLVLQLLTVRNRASVTGTRGFPRLSRVKVTRFFGTTTIKRRRRTTLSCGVFLGSKFDLG
uniref:endo-1,4-beta-xylanase n=1 Tax=Podospora anserina (strain S / ATCC MYA-4624 / DSM 980 / FGSC 10383) TaxID=515849 RepID=A0A090CP78_PODAN|nr:Putative Glycoside Hydrolase Family 10 [Podospora anserina S mat+]